MGSYSIDEDSDDSDSSEDEPYVPQRREAICENWYTPSTSWALEAAKMFRVSRDTGKVQEIVTTAVDALALARAESTMSAVVTETVANADAKEAPTSQEDAHEDQLAENLKVE